MSETDAAVLTIDTMSLIELFPILFNVWVMQIYNPCLDRHQSRH